MTLITTIMKRQRARAQKPERFNFSVFKLCTSLVRCIVHSESGTIDLLFAAIQPDNCVSFLARKDVNDEIFYNVEGLNAMGTYRKTVGIFTPGTRINKRDQFSASPVRYQ